MPPAQKTQKLDDRPKWHNEKGITNNMRILKKLHNGSRPTLGNPSAYSRQHYQAQEKAERDYYNTNNFQCNRALLRHAVDNAGHKHAPAKEPPIPWKQQ